MFYSGRIKYFETEEYIKDDISEKIFFDFRDNNQE